jgi:hypothetical protein
MAWWPVTEHLNKGYKEVVNSFSQLLNVATETNKLLLMAVTIQA